MGQVDRVTMVGMVWFGGCVAQGCRKRGRLCHRYFVTGIFSIFFLLLFFFLLGYICDQLQIRLNLVHFKDPPGILIVFCHV